MPIRDPNDNSTDTLRKLIEDVRQELDELKRFQPNLRGRRMSNASDAVSPGDLVTKRQLDHLAEKVRGIGKQQTFRVRSKEQAAGTLPPPNHPMKLCYWFVDRPNEGDPTYGDFYDEVKGYTNAYHAFENRGYGQPSTPTQIKIQRMAASMLRAANDGRGVTIHMWSDAGIPTIVDYRKALDAVQLAGSSVVWPKVYAVNLCDEFIRTRAQAESAATTFRDLMRQRNLDPPPNGIGITMTPQQVLNTDISRAAGIDFINIEAYIDPPGSPVSAENVAALRNLIQLQKAAVPSGKRLSIVMMAYARNGNPSQGTYTWSNFQTLADLQIPVYEETKDDERVFGIEMFSYGRYSGTRDIDRKGAKLGEKHRQIGAAIMGGSTSQQPGCRKLTTGGRLVDVWIDVIDRAIADNQNLVEYVNGITYVRAGSEGAFVAAVVNLFREPQYGLACIVNPEDESIVLVKPNNGSFSEAYAVYASDRRVRYTDNAYLLTCVPSEF